MTKFKKISALALIVFTVVILLSVGLTACNWQQVTIVLDCDGGFLGEDASVSLDVKTGEKTDLSAYVPEKDGYVFGGWSDGKTIYKADYVPTGDVTLKAVWLESSAGSTFNALKALFAALDGGDEAFAFAFEGEGKTAGGTVSGLSLKARVSAEDDYTLGFELSENGEKTIGIYVMDGVVYVWSPDLGGIALEDFDADYLLNVITCLPGFVGDALDGINLSGLTGERLISMLFALFTKTTVYEDGGDTVYNIQITPKNLQNIASIINLIDLDSILQGAGLNIKLTGLINWFKGILPDMTINVGFSVDKETGQFSGMTSDATYEGEYYFDFATAKAGFYSESEIEPVEPSVLQGYQQISLGNIDLGVNLTVQNEGADLGALINVLTGTQTFADGALVLSSGLKYRLDLKTSLDIAQKEGGDNNYIVLELSEIKADGSLSKFVTAYYKEGYVYIDVDRILGGIYGGKSVKIGVDLSELIAGVKKTVTDAIDGVFFTEGRALTGNAKLNTGSVVALSGTEGNYYVSDGVLNFLQVLIGVFGVDGDKITVSDGEDADGTYSLLNINVDNEFLTSFLAAIGTKTEVPDFGKVTLGIKLNDGGLSSLSVDAALKGGVNANIFCDSFAIGKSPEFEGYDGIADYIDAMIGDESRYTVSVKDIVTSVLEGVTLDVGLKLTLAKGNYNIMDIVSLFGVENKGGAVTPWTVTADSVADARLSAKLALDPSTNKLSAEVILSLEQDFNIGADTIVPAGQLIAVYLSEDGTGYIDLSNLALFGVNLPALKAEINIASVIDSLMASLDKDLVFDVSGLFESSEEETLRRLNADGSAAPLSLASELSAEGSEIVINSDSLKINLTLATVSALLNAFGVQFALPDGLDVKLAASLDGDGLKVNADASLPASEGYDALGLGLALTVQSDGLSLGADGLSEEIENDIAAGTAGLKDAQSNVIKALLGTVGKMSIGATIDVSSDEQADLGAFVKQFVEKWLPDTDIDVDIESGTVKLLVALNSERGEYSVILAEGEGNVLIGARASGETIVVTVTDFGSFLLRDTGIVGVIEDAVNKAIDGIENADLNKLFENLLNPSGEETPSDPETPEEPENPEDPSDGGTAIDIISLLGGVSVDDAVINIDITREMIASILSALGIDVDFVSAGGVIDVVGGKAEVDANIGDGALVLGIGLEIGRTDDESIDYGFATDLLAAYGDEGFTPTGEQDAEALRTYLVKGLNAFGAYRTYMESWSLSALASEYTRYLQSDGVLIFTSRADLAQYLTGLLEGVSLEADITVDFTPGEYNILELVGKFVDITSLGLPADSSLIVSLGEPSIDLSLRFNSAIREKDGNVDGVMAIEIIANRDLALGTSVGGGEGVKVISAGEALLALYIRDGSLYIDVTALEVLGLNLPVFKADDFDLPAFIYKQIDNAISGLLAEEESADGNAETLALANGEADGGSITLIVARNRLELSATLSAVGAILANFLTGDAAATAGDILGALGDVRVDVSLTRDDSQGKGVYDFSLSAEGSVMQTVDGTPSQLRMEVGASTADIKVGDETLYENFGAYVDGIIAGYDKTYSDILRGIADNLFKGSMVIDVDVNANEGRYYLNGLVNNILTSLTDSSGISVPIAVETGEFTKSLQLALQWNLDPDTRQLKLMFEIRSAGNVLIGAYMYDGELVVDLTGVGLVSVKVTNVAVITQLTETLMNAIDSLQGLDLNELLGGLFGDGSASTLSADTYAEGDEGEGEAPSSDNAWIAQLLGVVMLENANIKLALSTQLLEDIIFALAGTQIDLGSDLFDLSANLGILTGIVEFDATLFGDGENALISMSVDASLSNDTIVSNAYIQAVFLREHYELDATDTGSIVKDILDEVADAEFSVDLSVAFKKGTYNVAELLADFGVSALAGTQLLWTFTEDTNITLTLKVSLKTYSADADGAKQGMAAIEIIAKNDFTLGSSNFIKAGSVVLGLYAYGGVTYLDTSGIELLGITFPVFKVDFDLMGAITEKLLSMTEGSGTDTQTVAVVTDETGETTVVTPVTDENGEIVLGISEGEIAVTATLGAIISVLGDLGIDLGIDLSSFDLSAAIRIKDGLSVEIGGVLLPTTDGEKNAFDMKISIPSSSLILGIDVNSLRDYLSAKAKEYADYNDDIIKTIKQTLGNNSIRGELIVDAEASEVDLNSLISGLLKTLGVDLSMPVKISFDELYYDLEILLNWNIETRQLMLEVNMLGMINNKTILGLYGDSNDLYIALAGIGLVDLQVKGSPLVAVLFNKLDEAINGIDPIIISDLLNELFYGKDITEEAQNAAAENGADGEAPSGTEELANGTNDIIRYLLSSIKITDSQVAVDITSDIMSQIFRALGFNIDFVLEASLGVDLAGDMIEAEINLGGEASIDLALGFNGKPDRFVPSDTSKFVVLDTTNAEVDGGQVVKDFLDGFELALAFDLKSNSVGTAADSSEEPNMYTRVELKKITGQVTLDNSGVTVGSVGKSALLMSLYDINEAEYYTHGSGSKTAMLHFYLDYASGKATIYLCKGYFKIVGLGFITIDVTDFVSNFALDLDILGMLAPTVENLIKQVNDAANNLGQEETPGETTPPSQDQGTTEEVTGIAKVFAELDIEALLRPGINVNLSSTGVGNINVNLDPYELNKMVDGIFSCIFGADTIIDMTTLQLGNIRFSRNYLAYMWWDRTAASNTRTATDSSSTPYSTWDSIIRQLPHIVDDALNGMGGALSALGGIVNYERTAQNLHRIVKRLLPLAAWNEAEVNVNFVEGTLTNVSFTGTDTGQKIEQYALNETTGEWENTHKVLTQTVRTKFNVVDTSPDAEGVYTYYYEYGSYGDSYYGGKGIMHRTGFSEYLGSYSYTSNSFGTEIQIYNKSSSVGDPSYTLNGTDGVVDWGNLSQKITFNPYMYSSSNGYQAAVDEYWNRYFSDYGTAVYQKGTAVKRGTISLAYNGSAFNKDVLKTLMNRAGTHTVKATATYSDGTTSTMNISITVKDVWSGGADCVRSVDAVNLHVYESVPDYFTVTTNSGERIKYYTDGSTVSLTGDYIAASPSGGTKTAYLTFANGSKYPVTINYYDSTIKDQTIELSWYDLDFTGSDTTEGRDKVVQSLLDRFDMYYADGTFIPQLLTENAVWNTDALYDLVVRNNGDLSAATVEITVKLNKRIGTDGVTLETLPDGSGLVQTVTLTLKMADKRKLAVVYDGMTEGNYLAVDPYRYYLYKVTGDEKDNPIPATVTATYADGSKEVINTVTEFAADTDWSYTTDKSVKATLKIDPTKYEGKGYFDENMQINVKINRNVIAAVYFDEAKTQDYIVRGESYQTATVVFTNGLELVMPVAVIENGDKADVYIGFDVNNYVTYGKITTFSGINGTLLQAFTVEIR